MAEWEDTTGITSTSDLTETSGFDRDRPRLVVLSGMHLGQTFALNKQTSNTVGRSRRASIRLVDEGVSREHIRITADATGGLWLHDMESRNGTFCNGERVTRHLLRDGDKIQLGRGTMLRFTYLDAHDEGFQRLMYDSALRDGLTRAFNLRYFLERLDAEFRFAERHAATLSLLLFDIDNFKAINDKYGHGGGDLALTEFVDLMQKSVRSEDVLARLGGDEFALITRSVPMESAAQVAERLRQAVQDLSLAVRGVRMPLTVSIGLASFPDVPVTNAAELREAADVALYAAKERGRNACVVYHPDMSSPKKSPDPSAADIVTSPE